MACFEMIVPVAADGLRVDVFAKKYMPQVPALSLQQAFRRRDVKVNGVRVKQDCRVHSDDRVQVYCMEVVQEQIDIVYEDDDVVLVNKRSGVSVVPDDPESTSGGGLTLTEMVRQHLNGDYATPCHRLDNKTCGLTMFAKSPEAEAILLDAFRDRTLDKRYICLVRGMMKPPSATCSAYLLKDAGEGLVTILDHEVRNAKPITTAYETL